jgi:hypothetical protein
MIAFMVRTGLRMLTLAGLLYFGFFVQLGPRTLYGHLSRIAATEEAGELSTAVSSAAKRFYSAVTERVLPRGRP